MHFCREHAVRTNDLRSVFSDTRNIPIHQMSRDISENPSLDEIQILTVVGKEKIGRVVDTEIPVNTFFLNVSVAFIPVNLGVGEILRCHAEATEISGLILVSDL